MTAGSFAALVVAGEALRRGRALDAEALGAMALGDARAMLAAFDVDAESRRLGRALDDALEAALAETDEERDAHVRAALEALVARDRIESAVAAVAELARAAADAELGRALADVRAALARLDGASRAAAMLAPLNEARRRERDRLAGEHRARAWWWSARAECDAMVAMLRGDGVDAHAAHLASCADCRRDRESMAAADAPPLVHLTADELWSFDVGAMTKDERRRAQRHAARCAECKRALDALAVGEDAIAASEPPPGDDVVAEHAAFVVRCRRDAKRVRLIVEARGAALRGASIANEGVRARKTERGLELSVAASAARGPLTIVVEASDGPVAVEVDLTRRR